MLTLAKPIIQAHLIPVLVPGDGVILVSPDNVFGLQGRDFESIIPLLDGSRSQDDIVDALADSVDPARVYYALAIMEKFGYLCEYSPPGAHEPAEPARTR